MWLVTEGEPTRGCSRCPRRTRRKGINGVAFSPDGTRVMAGDLGITAARVWDVGITGDAELANLPAVAVAYGAVDFTPDGRHLVATSAAGSVAVWDAQAFTRVRTLGAPSPSSAAPTLTVARAPRPWPPERTSSPST